MQFEQTRFDSSDCIAAVHDDRLKGRVEGKEGRIVHSSQCFLVIRHLIGWTKRLSQLTSPWERPTASLIYNSLLPYIPIISSCTVETLNQPMQFLCFCVLNFHLFNKEIRPQINANFVSGYEFCRMEIYYRNGGKCYILVTLEI